MGMKTENDIVNTGIGINKSNLYKLAYFGTLTEYD